MTRPDSKVDRLKPRLLANAEEFVRNLLPSGKKEGEEWVALNPTRADTSLGSFKVNLRSGRWSDFATGESGDLLDLYCYTHRCSVSQALIDLCDGAPDQRELATPSKAETKTTELWSVLSRVPESAPKPYFNRFGIPSGIYEFRTVEGFLLGYTVRVEKPGGKDIRPLTLCKNVKTGETIWRWQSWPKPTPLYGLETLGSPERNQPHVLIVEGEKAADAAKSLLPNYPVLSWLGGTGQVHKADWDQCRGLSIVIWPDRDDKGITAAHVIAKSLSDIARQVFVLKPPAGNKDGWDIADAKAEGWDSKRTSDFITGQLNIPSVSSADHKDGASVKRKPTYEDYREFFNQHLKDVRRDLLTGRLYFRLDLKDWRPVANFREALESHAIDSEVGLAQTHVKPHLGRFTEESPKTLLVDIPKWDGVDRIEKFAKALHFKPCSAGNRISEFFAEQLKAWGCDLFKRLDNPSKQNRVFILKGPQGIGKDTLIKSILGGFGHYYVQPTLSRDEKENFITLAGSIAVHIPEFDRTTKIDVSALKNLVTTETALFRWPYDREPTRCQFRYSIMSSCNVDDILRDSTGNRRFVIFELERIEWDTYPREESLQVLAQFKNLAAKNFRLSDSAEQAMAKYISDKTPMSTDSFILDAFDSMMATKCGPLHHGLSFQKVAQELSDIARQNEVSVRAVQSLLARSGRSKRTNTGMVYLRVATTAEVLAAKIHSRTRPDSGSPPPH